MFPVDRLRRYSRSKLWTKTNRDDIVALFLTSEISRLQLKHEERFPINQSDIAKALGVSIQSVNKAWQQLEAEGVIELKRGVGVVIKDPDRINPDVPTLQVYFEIRKHSERQLVRLAVENATYEDFQAMQSALDEQAKAVGELEQIDPIQPDSSAKRNAGIFRLFLSDLEFHAAVREAAKDPWLAIIGDIAEARTQIMRLVSLSAPGRLQEILDSHRAIFEAIEARREEDAVKAVEKHFDVARKLAKPVLGEGG